MEAIPCFLANANTVFFWLSVGSTAALSPVRCTSSIAPERETLTLTSLIRCVPPSRVTRTTRVSAFP